MEQTKQNQGRQGRPSPEQDRIAAEIQRLNEALENAKSQKEGELLKINSFTTCARRFPQLVDKRDFFRARIIEKYDKIISSLEAKREKLSNQKTSSTKRRRMSWTCHPEVEMDITENDDYPVDDDDDSDSDDDDDSDYCSLCEDDDDENMRDESESEQENIDSISDSGCSEHDASINGNPTCSSSGFDYASNEEEDERSAKQMIAPPTQKVTKEAFGANQDIDSETNSNGNKEKEKNRVGLCEVIEIDESEDEKECKSAHSFRGDVGLNDEHVNVVDLTEENTEENETICVNSSKNDIDSADNSPDLDDDVDGSSDNEEFNGVLDKDEVPDAGDGGDDYRDSHDADCSNSNNNDNSNSEDRGDEEDDFDLEHDEYAQRDTAKLRSSRLMMAIQGFRSKSHRNEIEALMEGCVEVENFDPESIIYKGQTYLKDRCYEMKPNIEGDSNYSTVGILRFLPPQRDNVILARCVLIVPFEDTILGMEDEGVSFTADFKPSSYVRVHQCIEDVPISRLESESTDVETIPEIIYDPQKPGNCHQFGYFFDKSKIKRRGKRRGLRVLEIFIGAGGMHQGYRNAGFKIVKGVDNDKSAIRTLQANFNDTPVYLGDVKDFLSFLQTPGGRELLGRVDHVHLSPPCQGFSGANRNGGANDEINNALSMLIIDFVRITKCTTAVFENVLGMWRRKHIHYVKNICKELLKLGYQVRCASLKACDYGDAQKRPRFFIFASHKSAPPPIIPPRTHGDGPDLLPFVIVKDVLGNIQHADEAMMNMNGRTTSLQPGQHGVVRLDPNGLAPAIRASSVPPLHYDEDRCINVREAASLQSFPIDYVFYGDMRSQYRQVGNAVPVELATAVAQSVRQILIYEYEREG